MKKRVLVVDDDASIRSALKKVLEAEGFDVTLSANGQEAAERFVPDVTDLVILDLKLPGQSGWDIFEDLTRRDPCVPVIIITALSNQARIAEAAGVGALLEKPLAVPVLLETMNQLFAESPIDRLRRLCGYKRDTLIRLKSAGQAASEGRLGRNSTPLMARTSMMCW
jgi:DNA-binding response OmpR family regulator